MPKRAHRAAVVVDQGRPVGVVTEHDCAEVDRFAQVGQVMNPAARARGRTTPTRGRRSTRSRPPRAPLAVAVSPAGDLVGVLTRLGALRATLYTACGRRHRRTADRGRGRASTATSPTRPHELLDAGVDCLVVDTAHGHQERMIEALRAIRALDPAVPIVAGNVVAADRAPTP